MHKNPCVVCELKYTERHHYKSVASGGTDDDFNIMYLCRRHHQEFHFIGSATFAKKYDRVTAWLIKNGWQIINGKWKHL